MLKFWANLKPGIYLLEYINVKLSVSHQQTEQEAPQNGGHSATTLDFLTRGFIYTLPPFFLKNT